MKKVLNFGSLLLILTLLLSACGKDPKLEVEFSEAEMGRVALSLGTAGDFEIISKAGEAPVDVTDFVVRIFGTTLKNTAYDQTWNKYSEMPSVVSIPAGSYTIEAYNGSQVSGFETPYYYGSRSFSLGIQEYAEAQVTCQLACVKLSVEFTQLFVDNVTNPSCLVHTTDGVSLEFDMTNHTKIGYIAAPADGRLAVTIRGQYIEGGGDVDKTFFIDKVVAKQWHRIKLSVNTEAGLNNTGGMIQLDHTVSQKDQTILVPGSGDVIGNNGDTGSWEDNPGGGEQGGGTQPDLTAPKITGKGFDIEQVLPVSKSESAPVVDVQFDVENKIDQLIVTIKSPALTADQLDGVGLAETFDIANVDPAVKPGPGLVDLGLMSPDDPIKGKTSHVFSVGSFMPLLAMLPDGVGNIHEFQLRVVDVKGLVTEKTLSVRIAE